jgi:hypothetical protein
MSETEPGKTPNPQTPPAKVQGEGDYEAGRRFQKAERNFVEHGPVKRKTREAAQAVEGPEGEDLERARRETAAVKPVQRPHPHADASDPEAEDRLDEGLDETFPASDPVSIFRGAD